MTRLAKRNVTFLWGLEQQATFERLRRKPCEAPILTLSEGVDDFLVYYDASVMGLGAVFM